MKQSSLTLSVISKKFVTNPSFFLIVLITFFSSCTATYHTTVAAPPATPPPQQDEASYQVFYNDLGSYGRWIDYPGEGYVWSPNVDPSFQPYATNGHWIYTDQGWTWVSDYSWGWAAFHYGRWFYEDGYGWLWLPGHQWAPAWVTWGHSGNYYGWAPLGPHVEGNQPYTPPARYWTFVPQEHMTKPNVSQYVVDRSTNENIVKNVTIINNTTVVNNHNVTNVTNNNVTNNTNTIRNNTTNTVNNTNNQVTNNTSNTTNNQVRNNNSVIQNNHNVIINQGPKVNEVEKVTNTPIQKAVIVENNRPTQTQVNNNKVVMYRPMIQPQAMQKNGSKPTPQKVETYQKRH